MHVITKAIQNIPHFLQQAGQRDKIDSTKKKKRGRRKATKRGNCIKSAGGDSGNQIRKRRR